MMNILKEHWKIYIMEGICLGLFMTSASFFATILEYPQSFIHRMLPDDFLRLCIMGVAMGSTAAGIIYSPVGKYSGAHMNPAVTLSFLALGKIKPADAIFYLVFQIVGGLLAVVMMSIILGDPFEDGHVNYVVTVPGKWGNTAAFLIEILMSFGMMIMVLIVSNHSRFSNYTGGIAGILVMCYVILSAPVSGFSINPTRTVASAIPSGMYTAFWIYMSAPFIGMFSAAFLYTTFGAKTRCAKLHHDGVYRCIFNCEYHNEAAAVSYTRTILSRTSSFKSSDRMEHGQSTKD